MSASGEEGEDGAGVVLLLGGTGGGEDAEVGGVQA